MYDSNKNQMYHYKSKFNFKEIFIEVTQHINVKW